MEYISIINFIASTFTMNWTNLTESGLIRVAFDPYLSIFGSLTWGIIFGFIGGAIYANQQSLGTATAFLIISGVFFGIVFPNMIGMLFGMMLAFLFAVIFYKAFVERRDY